MSYICSEETEELIQAVKEFCDHEVREQSKEYDRSGEWPKEIYDKAMEMQLHMLEIPEEYGGKHSSPMAALPAFTWLRQ